MWSSTASPMPPTSATSVATATIGYDSQSATPVLQNGRGGLEGLDENPFARSSTLLIQETMDNSGRATAPSTYWDSAVSNQNALSDVSGRRSADPLPSSSLGRLDDEDHYLEGGSLLAESLGLGLQRSRSAAPSFGRGRDSLDTSSSEGSGLAPPPGLSRLGEQITRPASAGIMDKARSYGGNVRSIGSSGAVRPAAKTLMDLIQEEIPAEEQASSSQDRSHPPTPQAYFDGGVTQQHPPQQQQVRQLDVMQQQQQHNPNQMLQPRAQSYEPSQTAYNVMSPLQQQAQATNQQSFNANMDNLNYGMQAMNIRNPNNASPVYMERSQMPQRYAQTGFDNVDSGYGLNTQIRQQRQHQQVIQLQQQQDQLYYQQAPQPTQQQQPTLEVQGQRLQAQMLPNGQTVYVQAPTQQTQSMGYASTMQFASAGAPAPTTQLYQRGDGQYVSVVPVQPSPSQPMTFWQADGTQGQTVIVTGSAGGGMTANLPQSMMHSGRDTISPGLVGGRQGRGGGRRGRNDRHSGRRGDGKGGSAGMSSPILEEFRSNKNRQWTVAHIEGHVVEFCQDQNGSRFIQQRLEMGDLIEQGIVIREVLPAIRRLRNDVFGNYVVQKLLDFGTPEVRSNIRDTLEGEMMQLSLQMYGCRVVQKALETLEEEDLSRLLREFHHNVLSCIYDQNGNHVIQKCIEVINTRSKRALSQSDEKHANSLRSQIDFVINDVLVNAASLSCHPYGCRVLQRILEHCDEDTKHKILDEVKPSHKRLLDDQYGNYVIQHVLQFGRTSDRDSILQIVVESGLLGLSRQKFASNVVEKLLKYGNSNHRRAIAAEMLHKSNDTSIANKSPDGTSVVLLMVRDAYANYVVQTTLDVVPESDEKRALLRELKAHSEELVRELKMLHFWQFNSFLMSNLLLMYRSSEKLHVCKAYCLQACYLDSALNMRLRNRTKQLPPLRNKICLYRNSFYPRHIRNSTLHKELLRCMLMD